MTTYLLKNSPPNDTDRRFPPRGQLWRVKYLDLLIEQLEENSQVELSIRKLTRLSNGKLKDEPEEDLIFEQTKKPHS